MNAKYQIFVSSTYNDLKDERDLVIRAALEMGHIPVGMEMFSAADEEQWNIIKRQIDESDYYVVIAAHRYGSCDAAGLSYTEKEYDYAVSKGIPVLGFLLDSSTSWPLEKSENENSLRERLQIFKEKIRLKPVSFWKNKEDLYGRCSIALMKAFNAYPREGWVRASNAQDINAAKELARLSAENSQLRTKVATLEADQQKISSVEKTSAILKANSRQISVWPKGGTKWENLNPPLTLYQIFEAIGPELRVEADLEAMATFIAVVCCVRPTSEVRAKWPIPRNTLRALLADLSALDCVRPSIKRKSVEDQKEYWCLDEHGIELLAHMRRRRLQQTESLAQVPVNESDDAKEDQLDASRTDSDT